jgi:hypothetical protein
VDVFGILAILIYALYQKKKAEHIDYCIHHQNINQNLEAPIE